ncbi:hypothetical protein OCS_06832 [Ophiocordyceps sinensis CO18]|uniref:Uncharacterized protein n=1 Tax=Ophiocordyceps sinensis (strain Co18 / CGMCC 3.14243) TaxID=911162 RepID=T5A4X3_OPHSC|nr:hypothetical protein OCS_06832 [Ophiocordyceps sinensis CO18]
MFTRTVSEGDSTSPETQRKLGNLRNALRDARQLYKHPEAQSEKETKRIPESERDRLLRLEKDKQTPRNFSQRVRWRTQTKQWSRAQEPGLSPIAQSHADHDFGSRIPSKHQAAEEWPEPRASGRLVDLASPTGASISFQRVAEEQSRDSRVGSPSSTSTVIRTPKRQSLAHLTPSAWELFENGINFDDSEFSEPGQQLGMPTAMPASADATQRRAAQGPTGRSPDCVVVSQGETRHLHSSSTLQGAASNLGNLTERTHLGPGRQLGTAEVANLDPLTRVRGQKVNARGQLRKLMPPLVYFRTKKMDGSRNQPGTGEGEASPPALSSMANLGLLQKCQGQEPMRGNQGLQEPEVTPGTIGGSPPTVADRTRGQVPSMGSPGPEAWRMEPIKTHEDSEWVEQALKDLTDKSNQLMEEFASTRTTTTTGYDRLGSCSNQPEDGGANTRGTREAQRPVARRQVSRLLYNLASPSPSKQHDLGPPATSPSPKTSLSSGQTGQGTAADTTSTSPLADNAQPMEGSDVASFASAALEKQSSSGECSTLLTSMSTPTKCRGSSEGKSQEPGGQAMAAEMEEGAGAKASGEAKTDKQPLDRPIQTADDRGPTAREECEGEKQYVPNPPADGKGPRQTDGIEEDSEKQYVPNPSADGKGPRQTDGIEEDSEVPSPWMHMPGAFPAPPDIQVGRADGVEETSIGKADMDMEAKGEASGMRTNQCHTWVSGAMELLLLYWESIRPVLDTRSEYWERNAKHETTLADGLALALAMPVAILGAVALV